MDLKKLAQDLIDGNITPLEWENEMRTFIQVIHREATILAMDGVSNVTPAIWGYEGSLVKKQYNYLSGFVDDIVSNPDAWMNKRLLARMEMYAKADFGTFEAVLTRKAELEGLTEERRVLGAADHCPCCLDQASIGWAKIGDLLPIGGCVCLTNCHCHKEYR